MPPSAKTVREDVTRELDDLSNSLTAGLLSCGTQVVTELQTAAHDLAGEWRMHACKTLDDLANTAYSRLSASKDAPLCWRRLYTDTSVLRTLGDLEDAVDQTLAKVCIARLDRAIITAGPCGEGRLELVLDLIREIQSEYLNESPRPYFLYSRSRPVFPAPQSPTSVPRLPDPPSFTSFISTHSLTPFVISRYATDWPATKAWHNVQYLRTVAGPGRVVPVEVGGDYRAQDWTQRIMEWDAFVDTLRTPSTDEILYLAQHNLFKQFPKLREDVMIPDYVYASLPAPQDFPEYTPPGNDDQLVENIWLGPVGTVSPAHTDPYFNLYAQLVGSKTVWLAPPSATSHMYPFPPAETSIGHPHNPAANNTNPSMSNTSRVDVFAKAGEDEFPDFWAHAIPQSMWITLGPGDVLFFPPGWWHAMRSEEMSFSMSIWF